MEGPTGAVAECVSVCVCVGGGRAWWGCSFKQAFEWSNCIGIQQSESWFRSRRAAGGVSARTSTATLSKRAPAQSAQLMLSLSLTLSPLFVLSHFSLILLLTPHPPSSPTVSQSPLHLLFTTFLCLPLPASWASSVSSLTHRINPPMQPVSLSIFDAHSDYSKNERRGPASHYVRLETGQEENEWYLNGSSETLTCLCRRRCFIYPTWSSGCWTCRPG